ncbi:MAG: LamG domain-containing protein, partial [Armatimonadetes bacterium]|nr:LamG domain-containing protein [Armatimonadota bacterium]
MLILMFLATALQAPEPGVMGYWPFDGTLADASGQGHDAAGDQPAFAAGHAARALDGQWTGVSIPDHPDLRLAPGLGIDTWVYFDKHATGYEVLVMKDQEYQLRVDGPNEGGRFSFFVHLAGGWEPRVSGSVPEAGKWYHLVATWTGSESILQINEERYTGARRGNPAPAKSPITVGHSGARIDDLRLLNPALARAEALTELLGNTPGAVRTGFEGAGAWSGWKGLLGATAADRGD